MKLVTWNCNGALRNKFESLIDLDADLIVVQECENPKEAKNKNYSDWATNYLWIGDNKNRGLGIFAKQHLSLEQLGWADQYQNHRVKYFLPCSINEQFELIAVWAHKNNSPNFGYIGQIWKYLQINKTKFTHSIIIGDFNSNAIWDEWDRWWNHSDVVRELQKIGIKSLYHQHTNEEQGKESQYTFYFHRHANKPYHIDYCFASSLFANKLKKLSVEPFDKWKELSDHVPVVITLDK